VAVEAQIGEVVNGKEGRANERANVVRFEGGSVGTARDVGEGNDELSGAGERSVGEEKGSKIIIAAGCEGAVGTNGSMAFAERPRESIVNLPFVWATGVVAHMSVGRRIKG
jgi:hypothetical protein